jgi:hypothetical protein
MRRSRGAICGCTLVAYPRWDVEDDELAYFCRSRGSRFGGEAPTKKYKPLSLRERGLG